MKRALSLASMLLFAVGCTQQSNSVHDSFAKQTYIHQYGVTVSKKDWDERGKNGIVIATDRTGVTATRNYRNGTPHGDSAYSFAHSEVIESVESYDNGVLIAKTLNYPNGMPRQSEKFEQNVVIRTTWFEAGTPASVERYEDNRLVSGEYYNPHNELATQVKNGRGVRTRYDSFGELIAIDKIEHGVTATSTQYHANGTPKAVIPYVDGQIDGKKCTYYAGGEPKTIEDWRAGVRTGTTVVFRNGQKAAEVPYRNGRKHGIEKRFRDGVALAEEVTWVQNRRHGPTKVFADQSNKTDWYYKGQLVSQTEFSEMDEPLPSQRG